MTTALNYCNGGGYIVGPSYDLPDDPSTYHADDRNIIGCNSLVCDVCHTTLRHILGFSPVRPPTGDWRKVYDTQDWSTFGWSPSGARAYVCRCFQVSELHATAGEQLMEMKGISWHCAGHPPSALPLDIDGNEITRFTDLSKLLRKAATDALKLPLAKVYARLLGTPLQTEVERVIQTFLTDDDPRVRRKALGFYWGHPNAPGATTVLALAEGDRALFRGIPDEGLSEGKDLEARLILTLGQLWMSGSIDSDRAQELLRVEAKKPGRLRPTLASLAVKDTEWLMQHAKELLESSPESTGKLIIELERALGSIPALLEVAKRSRPKDPDALAAARTDIETYATSSLRDPLLAIFSEPD